jgi:hypothetical protein
MDCAFIFSYGKELVRDRRKPTQLETYHELTTHNTFREAWVVLNVGRGGQLAARSNAISHEAFVKYRYANVSHCDNPNRQE